MNDQKLSHYHQGTVRKSKREKEKEAAEAKRKEEEENTAKAYTEFLDAFQGEDADRRKAGAAFVRAGHGQTYEPSVKKEPIKPASVFEDDSGVSVLFTPPDMRMLIEPQPPSPLPLPKPKGKRAMDSFLEEIKRCVDRAVL